MSSEFNIRKMWNHIPIVAVSNNSRKRARLIEILPTENDSTRLHRNRNRSALIS